MCHNGLANGLAHKVAHKKCATENKCATNGNAQAIEISEENITPAHMAHLAHVSEDIGEEVASDFEPRKTRLRI